MAVCVHDEQQLLEGQVLFLLSESHASGRNRFHDKLLVRRSATEKQSVGRRSGTRLAKYSQRRLRTGSACSMKHTWTSVTDPS
eukprot:1652192-Pleurochrysis_carterae.AAC.1